MSQNKLLEMAKKLLKAAKENPEALKKTVSGKVKSLRALKIRQETAKRGIPRYKDMGTHIAPNRPHEGHYFGINHQAKFGGHKEGTSVVGAHIRDKADPVIPLKEQREDKVRHLKQAPKPNLPKSEEIQDDIQKMLKVVGGHVGQTKSGKPIGFDIKSKYSLGFTHQDHKDAYNAHYNAAQATSDPKLKAHHMNMTKLHMQSAQRSEGPASKPSAAPHTMRGIHQKSEQEPNLIVDKEIRMDKKTIIEMANQLIKAAKENPAGFDEALKKAMAAPAPAPAAAAPKAPAKQAAPKPPKMQAPAMSKCGDMKAMKKEERSAMIKEELKADWKPKFRK